MRFNYEKLNAHTLPNTNYLVFLVYAILSIIFTYPVAFSRDEIPGGGDVWWFLWDLWSFKKAALNLSNPYYNVDIFHPTGVSLAFSDVSTFNTIISIPLQQLFGLVISYKIVWILTFVLSGISVFLLVKYLTNNIKSAFLSGLIFMFCPYHFAHACGHMNLTTIQWIPLYVLFIIKMRREEKTTNAIYAAIFLVLVAMSSIYYLLYMSVFTLLYLIYYWIVDRSQINISFIKKFLLMSISFLIGFSPFIYMMLNELLILGTGYLYPGGFIEFSADLLAFFTPTIFHPIFKDFAFPINSHFTGNGAENTVFAGYTVLVLSIIAIVKIKTKEIRFWMISSIIFFILSLGPILHIRGVLGRPLENYIAIIPLPYAILMHIPIFSMARVPSRWDVLVMLSLAILAGYGLQYIFDITKIKSFNKGNKENIIFIVMSCLILFEFLAVPFPMSSAKIPAIYEQMAAETDDYAILEIPASSTDHYMYFQTLHGKKLVNGYVSRTPDYALEFTSHTPLISDLMTLSDADTFSRQEGANIWIRDGIMGKKNRTELLFMFNYYNIKYIIIHKDYLSDHEFSFASNLIHDTLGIEPVVYDRDGLWVYHIPTYQNSSSFMLLGSGFHGLEDWSGTPTLWMQANGTTLINSPENRTAILSLQALSFYRNRTVEVYSGDELTARVVVPTFSINVTVPIHLTKGSNTVWFHVPEGCERPSDKPELNNPDQRCLSVTVQNMSLKYI